MLQNRRGSASLFFYNVASRLEQQSVKKILSVAAN